MINFLNSLLLAMLIAVFGSTKINCQESISCHKEYVALTKNIPYKYFQDTVHNKEYTQVFMNCVGEDRECYDEDKILKDYISCVMKHECVDCAYFETLVEFQKLHPECIQYIQRIINGETIFNAGKCVNYN